MVIGKLKMAVAPFTFYLLPFTKYLLLKKILVEIETTLKTSLTQSGIQHWGVIRKAFRVGNY